MNERLAGDRYVVDAGIVVPRAIVYGLIIALLAALPVTIGSGLLVWQAQSDKIGAQQVSIEGLQKTIDALRSDNQGRDRVLDDRVISIDKYAHDLHDEVFNLHAAITNLTDRINAAGKHAP
jgi:hypothetical protein